MKDKMNLSRGRDRDRTARQVIISEIFSSMHSLRYMTTIFVFIQTSTLKFAPSTTIALT